VLMRQPEQQIEVRGSADQRGRKSSVVLKAPCDRQTHVVELVREGA